MTLPEFLNPYEYDSVCNSPDGNTRIFAIHFPVVTCAGTSNTTLSHSFTLSARPICDSPITLEEAFDSFYKGVGAGGLVWDQVLGYSKQIKKNPHEVLFLRYKEMKDEPYWQLRLLAYFVVTPYSKEEENSGLIDQIVSICSFESMTKVDVNKTGTFVDGFTNSSFFLKALAGYWKNCLTADIKV